MNKSPRVSIVVPSRDGRIDGLAQQLAEQSFGDWELIVNTDPPTPARARNRGAAQARGEILIFFDDDVRLGHECHLAQLVEAIEACGPRSAVGVPCRLAAGATAFQRRQCREGFDERIPLTGEPVVEVNWFDAVDGRCLAIPRAIFEELGGFDEGLISGEDYELLYRLRQKAGTVYALTTSWVNRYPPPNLRVALKKTIWYSQGNAQVARKHPDSNYRIVLRSRWHAAGYLLLRTAWLLPSCFLRASYHYRRPRLAWRPTAAGLSYIGAWVYCLSWFSRCDAQPPSPRVEGRERVKVLYLITGLRVGGAEKLLLATVRSLDRSRFEPVVATFVAGELIPEFERAGVRVHLLARRHRLDLGVVFRLRRLLLAERPTILHTHLLFSDFLGRVVGRWCRVPVVITTLHMLEPIRYGWIWRMLDRWASRWNHAIVAVSHEVKRAYVRVQRLDPSKFHHIPNAIEVGELPDSAQALKKREILGLPEGALLVGTVGRLAEPVKGHHYLLEAIAGLMPRWPALRCLVIGDGPGRQALEAQAKRLGLSEIVHFLGTRRDVPDWLAGLNLFVQPSLAEGSPLAVIEAMAAGRPIVASAVGGVPELVVDEESGLLVPPGDAVALSRAMERLFQDRAFAQQLGRAARHRFEQRFDLKQTVRQAETLYEDLLNRRLPNRIKLLEVVTSVDAGGVTSYLADLIQRLPRERFDVHLASGPEQFQAHVVRKLGIPYHEVGLTKAIHPLRDLAALWRLVRLLRRERFDVVHTHMAKSELIAGLAARLAQVPCVISTAHGPTVITFKPSLRQTLFDGLERFTYRCLHDRVIGVSQSTTAMYLKKKTVDPSRIVTLPNGIDVARIQAGADRDRIRRELGCAPEQPVMGMVGRLVAQKAPEVLIHSMGRLIKQWPDLVCLLIGDGPRLAEMEELIRSHRLEGSVKLLGHRDDVSALLSGCDLFVLSTHYEGMSISVLEAMAAGLPVVASQVEGMEELVDPGRTGLLFPPGDAAACAQAIGSLLAEPSRSRQMGQAALEKVREQFDASNHMRQIEQILVSSLIGSRRLPPPVSGRQPSWMARLCLYVQEEGIGRMMRRLGALCMSPLYHSARIWFFVRSVKEPMRHVKPLIPCAIRRAQLDDVDRLAAAGFVGRSAVLGGLRSPQDQCFLAEYQGRVVAYQWVALGERELRIDPIERPIRLQAGEAYLYNCRALRPFRSKGIIPAIEAEVCQWLAQQGFHTLYTDIEQGNRPSIRTFEKLGFEKVEAVALRRYACFTRIRSQRPHANGQTPHWRMNYGCATV